MLKYKKVDAKFYRINQQIRAQRIRVIDEKGKQVGILSLEEALRMAAEQKNDLVEIAPTAIPPVCKIINFKKFLYIEAKKEQKAKKGIKGGEIKGIRLTPFMAQGDFNVRLKKAEEFLKGGNKVKAVVRFNRKQLPKSKYGYSLLERLTEGLREIGNLESPAKWLGKDLIAIYSPLKQKSNTSINLQKNEDEKEENTKIDQPSVQNNENR